MVFIRPTILRTAEDVQAMTRAALQLCPRPPAHRHARTASRRLDEVVRDYLGTTPPVVPGKPRPRDQVVTPPPAAATVAAPHEAPAFRAPPQ